MNKLCLYPADTPFTGNSYTPQTLALPSRHHAYGHQFYSACISHRHWLYPACISYRHQLYTASAMLTCISFTQHHACGHQLYPTCISHRNHLYLASTILTGTSFTCITYRHQLYLASTMPTGTHHQVRAWSGGFLATMLTYLMLFLEHLHGFLKSLLLLLRLSNGGLVLLLVSHGDHSQDQVHQVEGAQEDDKHEEDHVDLPCGPQGLEEQGARGHLHWGPLWVKVMNSKLPSLAGPGVQMATAWGGCRPYPTYRGKCPNPHTGGSASPMEGGRMFQLTGSIALHRVDKCPSHRAQSILHRGLGTWPPAKGKFLCLPSPHPSEVPCPSLYFGQQGSCWGHLGLVTCAAWALMLDPEPVPDSPPLALCAHTPAGRGAPSSPASSVGRVRGRPRRRSRSWCSRGQGSRLPLGTGSPRDMSCSQTRLLCPML